MRPAYNPHYETDAGYSGTPPGSGGKPTLLPIDRHRMSTSAFSTPRTANTPTQPLNQLGNSLMQTIAGIVGPKPSEIDKSDNVKVAVRVRPLLNSEKERGAINNVVATDPNTIKVVVGGPGNSSVSKEFQFHACLGPEVGQQQLLQLCGIKQLLDAALSGYNVTIFAYGQTGSGKTYTMLGKEDLMEEEAAGGEQHQHEGIVWRSVRYLYEQVLQRTDAKYSLSASYLEVHNESVYDLIHFNQKSLPVKWDPAKGFHVPGLKVQICPDEQQMRKVVHTGMKHRKVGSHELNMESSRSHSIMTVYCNAIPLDPDEYDYGTCRFGKVSFVDLAGSERLKDSKADGSVMKESTNINKSLFVLGKVISALSERDFHGSNMAHIPYRDSKLTRLLMDSLGGSALSLMIACCSPSGHHVDETLSTLSYAMRAKNIQNRPQVQHDPREAQMTMLRREVELLRMENNLLREQLRSTGTPVLTPMLTDVPPMTVAERASVSLLCAAPSDTPTTHKEVMRVASSSSSYSTQASPQVSPHKDASKETPAAEEEDVPDTMELHRRLCMTEQLLTLFSEENSRLARENDRLRVGKQLQSSEQAGLIAEIDGLQNKLQQLETGIHTTPPGSGGTMVMKKDASWQPDAVPPPFFPGFHTPPFHVVTQAPSESSMSNFGSRPSSMPNVPMVISKSVHTPSQLGSPGAGAVVPDPSKPVRVLPERLPYKTPSLGSPTAETGRNITGMRSGMLPGKKPSVHMAMADTGLLSGLRDGVIKVEDSKMALLVGLPDPRSLPTPQRDGSAMEPVYKPWPSLSHAAAEQAFSNMMATTPPGGGGGSPGWLNLPDTPQSYGWQHGRGTLGQLSAVNTPEMGLRATAPLQVPGDQHPPARLYATR